MGNDKTKRNACRDAVMLFRNYHGFPDVTNSEGKLELVNLIDAMDRWTVCTEHATAVGMKLLEESSFCPRVVDFKSVGEELKPGFLPKQIGILCCGKCIQGFIITIDEAGIAHSRYCECHPGKPKPLMEPIPAHPQTPKPMKRAGDIA